MNSDITQKYFLVVVKIEKQIKIFKMKVSDEKLAKLRKRLQDIENAPASELYIPKKEKPVVVIRKDTQKEKTYMPASNNTIHPELSKLKTDMDRRKDELHVPGPTPQGVASNIKRVSLKNNRQIFVLDVKDREWIRFNLMETLYAMSYDIVVSEFKFAGCVADIFAVVENRGIEFEIKMSCSDIINDFKKRYSIGTATPFKHDYLAAGKSMISKFYFVVPEGMLNAGDCPDHCGLIHFDISMADGWLFKMVKPAPMLHKNFLTAGTWSTIAKRLAMRCKNMALRFSKNDFMAVRRLGIWQPRH